MNLKQTFRQLARDIDDIWPQFSEEERADFKRMMKRFRSCNPEFRAMWQRRTDEAALRRRYS